MKPAALPLLVLLAAGLAAPGASAKGCLKGAVVGGVGGAVVKHPLIGAAAVIAISGRRRSRR